MLDFTFLLWEGVIITAIIFFVIQKIRDYHHGCAVNNICPLCKGAGKFIFGHFLHKYGGEPEEIKDMNCHACRGKGDYFSALHRRLDDEEFKKYYEDEYSRIWNLHVENKFRQKLSTIKIKKINTKKENIKKCSVSMK